MSLEGIFRRRRLPHWDVADATYFVTTCLAGSIPALGLQELRQYRSRLDLLPCPNNLGEDEWEIRKHKLVFARFDELIDNKPILCHLNNEELALLVRNSLYHFAGTRYDLISYVVMPSHFHWVFRPRFEWCESVANDSRRRTPREIIMHSIKSYTANECNRICGHSGQFWQDESYDHCVRDDDELARIIEYVEANPVKARLAEEAAKWRFSSAYDRALWGIAPLAPLLLQ